MAFVDAVLLPVPKTNKDAYLKHAIEAAALFKAHGALAVGEAWGEDVPEGKINSMRTAVMLEPTETVVFSWILWPDRKARDVGMANLMKDPRMKENPMPFDGERLIYGGFEQIVDL